MMKEGYRMSCRQIISAFRSSNGTSTASEVHHVTNQILVSWYFTNLSEYSYECNEDSFEVFGIGTVLKRTVRSFVSYLLCTDYGYQIALSALFFVYLDGANQVSRVELVEEISG